MRQFPIGCPCGLAVAAAIVVLGWMAPSARGEEHLTSLTLACSAEDAWEAGQGGSGVQRDPNGGVVLYDRTLIEDDGPGVGANSEYQIDEDRALRIVLGGAVIAKKVLVVDRPEATEVRMYVRDPILVEVNGNAIGDAGESVPVPPEILRKGENVVLLRARPEANAVVKASARAHILQNNPELKDRPPRSFISSDDGKTWAPIDGELVCRLSLHQFAPEGSFASPVIDLAQGESNALSFTGASLRSLAITAGGETPTGTSIDFLVRTGTGPVYDAAAWTDWQDLRAALPRAHRFLQWRAVLRSGDPKATPMLRSVSLQAQVVRLPDPAWAKAVTLKAARNAEIRYTSMPFEYEDPAHPKVKALREKYKLDQVIRDGNNELEKLVRLRNWVCDQWKYKPPMEMKYPAWDADEILTRKIGFCVQYAITYVQCCAALGYPARFVFGEHPGTNQSGHEVTEVWSNQYGKWIVMDPEGDRYYVDPRTKEPLSMLESHDRMIRTFYGTKPPYPRGPQGPKYSDEIMSVNGREVMPSKTLTLADKPPQNWPAWTKWLYINYVPRNNFYSRPVPLPRIQGWGWEWPDHWVWYDEHCPRLSLYRYYTNRRSDLEWTLNQARFSAEYGAKAGTIAIQLGTVTPNFETFLVCTDGKTWKPTDCRFTWTLEPGRNRLEMRARNNSGREGPLSYLEVEYRPKPE